MIKGIDPQSIEIEMVRKHVRDEIDKLRDQLETGLDTTQTDYTRGAIAALRDLLKGSMPPEIPVTQPDNYA